MKVFESLEFSTWLPIILILGLIITILGLSYWYFTYRRHNKKKFEKKIIPSQLTNTDKAYLDKLVRTASDRSMWKRDYISQKDQFNKLRKVPSGQIEQKT